MHRHCLMSIQLLTGREVVKIHASWRLMLKRVLWSIFEMRRLTDEHEITWKCFRTRTTGLDRHWSGGVVSARKMWISRRPFMRIICIVASCCLILVCALWVFSKLEHPFSPLVFLLRSDKNLHNFSRSPIVKKLPYPIRILVYPGKIDNKGVSRKNCGWTWGQGGCSKNWHASNFENRQSHKSFLGSAPWQSVGTQVDCISSFFSTLPRMIENITYGQLWKADECRPFFSRTSSVHVSSWWYGDLLICAFATTGSDASDFWAMPME